MERRTLRTSETRAAEGDGIAFGGGKIVISLCVEPWVIVPEFRAGATVGEMGIRTPEMFAAIGFETVDANFIQQIGAFAKPPLTFGLPRYIPEIAAAEPERTNFVEAAIGFAHTKSRLLEIGVVGFVLGVRLFDAFEDRDLPQQHFNILLVQPIDHAFGVAPFAVFGEGEIGIAGRVAALARCVFCIVPDVEGGFVAPRFDDQHGGLNAMLQRGFDFFFDTGLRVPLVATHPQAEAPFGRQDSGASEVGEVGNDRQRVIAREPAEAQRFISVYDEYAKAPDVTRKRMFLETMEKVIGGSNKVIVEQGGNAQSVVPYLPLPELQQRRQTEGNN